MTVQQSPHLLVYCAGGLEHAGGIGRMLGYLLDAHRKAERGYDLRVIDTRGPYSIFVSPLFFAKALAQTVAAAFGRRPIAAHVNMAHAGSTIRKVIICRVLQRLGIPYLLHLHANNYDTYFRVQPEWAKRQIRRAFLGAERIVVLGSLWHDVVVGDIGAPAANVVIIRNGVPDPGQRRSVLQSGSPLLLFLGDLQPWKGLGELIEALGSDTLRQQPWTLICAGRGQQAVYQAQAERLGIANRISFTGWLGRADVVALLRKADIVTLPSHMEGLSVTLVEGLAYGIPVVATAVGAHPDILQDGETAILVQPNDVGSLTEGLRRVLSDKVLAESVGRGGRLLFEQSLDISRIEEQFDVIYKLLLRCR